MTAEATPPRGPGRPAAGSMGIPDEAEILRRGLAAFAELGYENASVRELARRLGVSHNFINDRYGSKEEFWKATVGSAQSALSHDLQQVLDREDDEIDRLRDGIRTFHRGIAANPDLAAILREEARSGSGRLHYLYDRHLRPIIDTLRPRLERLVAEGRVGPFPVDVILFSAIAMTQATNSAPLLRLLGDTADTDPDSILPMLSEIVLDGIIAREQQREVRRAGN
jgi:TetR/AcrR family transcriptional regulator